MPGTCRSAVTLVAALLTALACGDGSGPGPLYTITISAGDQQTDTVGRALAVPYAVLVKDTAGVPVPGVAVSWKVLSGGGSITASSTTDGSGLATATRTLGTRAGAQTAQAQAGGSSVTFTAVALAGAPAKLQKTAGDLQTGVAGAALPVAFAVTVRDPYDNPVPGIPVAWAVTAGGGSVDPTSDTTDAAGISRSTLTLGAVPAAGTATATVSGLATVTFSASAVAQATLVKLLPIAENYGIHDMYVRDGLCFVFAWNTGVLIYDVGNGIKGGSPSNPQLVGSIVTSASSISGGPAVHNGWWYHSPSGEKKYLFIGQEGPAFGGIGVGSAGLIHVVDVSDLANPVEVAAFHKAGADSTGTHNFWVDETNEILYAAYYNGGVVALDISGTLSGDLSSRLIDSIRPGGVGNTYVWGVHLYNGSLYVSDMLSGFWQLGTAGGQLSVKAGGNNVPERFGSDLWVANGYGYTGTWGTRSGHNGNAVKIWQLGATGAPTLKDSVVTSGIVTVSDIEVSASNQLLMFSAEYGPNAGFHFYSLADPARPALLARYTVTDNNQNGVHTATFATINGKRYVFGAKDPPGAALVILDVSSLDP